MKIEHYDENCFENGVMSLFREELGYQTRRGAEVERDYREPFSEVELWQALRRVNPNLPDEALDDAVRKIRHVEIGTLIQRNKEFTDYLQNGVEVRYFERGEERYARAYLLDYRDPENNEFVAVNQWNYVENGLTKRFDVVVYVNALPLVVVELKSPVRDGVDASSAYRQLRNYIADAPNFFVYNAFCVMSDMVQSKVGTITSPETRFAEWKSENGERRSGETTGFTPYYVLFRGLFEKRRFLDLVKNFVCFASDGRSDVKILAGYHQYFAVKKAVESTRRARELGDGKGGVFWHTQGSGKSFSMTFYAKAIQDALDSPTLVVLTDRNDLDDQLFLQFTKCRDFLRQTPERAETKEGLRELLEGRKANGIFFSTIHKFLPPNEKDEAKRAEWLARINEPLTKRRDVVVIADEAHRSQYGLREKFDKESGKTSFGSALLIRKALPNAVYLGFTGTPISAADRDTREVFGDYVDVYDMTQAVEDGATKPVYYESRVIKLGLNAENLRLIDEEYDKLAQNAESEAIERSKRELSGLDAVLGHDATVNALVDDILSHYEGNRANLLTGKALIVAYKREIAMKIYRRILELRPGWGEKVAVVMTGSNDDPEDWKPIIGDKKRKNELAQRFKDDGGPLKIAIVVDMWLTGFDVPSLATMYVYKPMKGHNLMQAIARVNRVFPEKEGGLVVDYVGIASALKEAMNEYTERDRENYGDLNVAKTALATFRAKLEVCGDLTRGFDYSEFADGSDLVRGKIIADAVDFVLAKDASQVGLKEEDRLSRVLAKEALAMKKALSLCASLVEETERREAAFFEALRSVLVRFATVGGAGGKKLGLFEINDQINELLKQSLKSEGVVNLFADVRDEFSLFDSEFMAEIAKMKRRNLAVELLKRLIAEQIKVYRRTNVVQAKKFSELFSDATRRYFDGLLTNEETIGELLNLAKEIVDAAARGEEMGLTPEEKAFYDALAQPKAVQDFYENEQLVALTKALTEELRRNLTIDWRRKKSARADMRRMVKRLLKRFKYPPEEAADALDAVLAQCETWADNTPVAPDAERN